ncbi:RNA polymerase sigma factor [Flavobacterium sp. MFBS3-15]|uniref:RNA polymerase sigma factor n=1 Tax=Flavobacterium sp. MFBS3-15 TaxID=2989816 RepID=UPI0022360FFE|nr:RNA polymerase sigma factor [Flavobacterium sp. MFBS3-15]MCW4469688.1 RNA polymerase sigma factor [Flavobacterium sp. MFBS3-15]
MEKPEKQDICDKIFFSAFFKAQAQALRNFLYFRFGDKDLAEDITQDAFIKLWQNCADVKYPKSFLYTVAKNAALNHTVYQKVVFKYADNNPGRTTDNQSPEYLMEEEEFRQKFEKAIAGLTDAQRVALLLNRIEGKKYKEIAEMLGITVKAVEKRIHGALLHMSEQIENFR